MAQPGVNGLDAHVVLRRGPLAVDLTVQVPPGSIMAVLGPNGAGKSTLLRVLAGLVRPAGGQVTLAGRVLDGPGVHVAPHDRSVGMVFQDHLLFPHLSTRDNVAFGPRARGATRAQARAVADGWIERMGLTDHAAAKPKGLSGGQSQRIALARALAVAPALLLLDEPLSALDARTKLDVRASLRAHLADYPGATVLVTHDPVDALALADRLIVVEQGRVVQEGAPAEVARRPRTDYVARLVGLSLLRGHGSGHTVALDTGGVVTVSEATDGAVFVAIRPSAVALHRRRPDGSPRNVWPVRVAGVTPYGETLRVDLGSPALALTADVTPAAAAELDLLVGAEVFAAVKATDLAVYPA